QVNLQRVAKCHTQALTSQPCRLFPEDPGSTAIDVLPTRIETGPAPTRLVSYARRRTREPIDPGRGVHALWLPRGFGDRPRASRPAPRLRARGRRRARPESARPRRL